MKTGPSAPMKQPNGASDASELALRLNEALDVLTAVLDVFEDPNADGARRIEKLNQAANLLKRAGRR